MQVHVILLAINSAFTLGLAAEWRWMRDDLPRWNVRLIVGMIVVNIGVIALNAVYLGALALGHT
jgi:hypothetical protein